MHLNYDKEEVLVINLDMTNILYCYMGPVVLNIEGGVRGKRRKALRLP